jgi:surfactin synthase thioesterase subunit
MNRALVCFPFAGGGAGFFRAWKDKPRDFLAIVPVQLPGREEAYTDPPFTDVVTAVQYALPQILEALREYPAYSLFGHSLGAVLAYEAAWQLTTLGGPVPGHLFVSGSPGPWAGRSQRATGLDDDEFIARVEQFAGYQHEALSDPELREILLPLLRADVEMHENYRPPARRPLGVPVTSLRGAGDGLVSTEETGQWGAVTTGTFSCAEVPGPHMYLADDEGPLLDVITTMLAAEAGHHAA